MVTALRGAGALGWSVGAAGRSGIWTGRGSRESGDSEPISACDASGSAEPGAASASVRPGTTASAGTGSRAAASCWGRSGTTASAKVAAGSSASRPAGARTAASDDAGTADSAGAGTADSASAGTAGAGAATSIASAASSPVRAVATAREDIAGRLGQTGRNAGSGSSAISSAVADGPAANSCLARLADLARA